MSSHPSDKSKYRPPIPILLLKTKSHPNDTYEEYFTTPSNTNDQPFVPQFVPVLDHQVNPRTLADLEHQLRNGDLGNKYGGMIFSSQRAVEAWADVVERCPSKPDAPVSPSTKENPLTEPPFPIYTVGPATSLSLSTLITQSSPEGHFRSLNPSLHGSHTGNGASLARYIQAHYNLIHSHRLFTFYESPRLPFIPLLGPPRGERINHDDPRLRKKPLLFLVGEKRRDVILRTLMDEEDEERRIEVDEVEVYSTIVRGEFEVEFKGVLGRMAAGVEKEESNLRVIVVFSPQGCEAMLRCLGFVDADGKVTEKAKRRWDTHGDEKVKIETEIYVVVTIGPTTCEHLKEHFDFDADVCAAKPSPEGVSEGILKFLKEKGLGT